jgi:hypothetical protein
MRSTLMSRKTGPALMRTSRSVTLVVEADLD